MLELMRTYVRNGPNSGVSLGFFGSMIYAIGFMFWIVAVVLVKLTYWLILGLIALFIYCREETRRRRAAKAAQTA